MEQKRGFPDPSSFIFHPSSRLGGRLASPLPVSHGDSVGQFFLFRFRQPKRNNAA